LSVLETLTKYLREELNLRLYQIANLLNKNQRTIWTVYNRAQKKKGYTEKDVIAETKKVAPFVKHVHLSDNFGLEHTELPMGMGNVPLDKVMKKLKKAGFDGQKIIEAGNWWQYFAEKGGGNPFRPSIEAFDSPLYSMKAGPGWSQLGGYGNYYIGHGPINPPMHHQMYGASFSTLPTELGGELPGDRSRMSGTPNQ